FAAGYKSVTRFVRKPHRSESPEARAVIETAPGEELEVDYGTRPVVRDVHSGKYRRTRLFVTCKPGAALSCGLENHLERDLHLPGISGGEDLSGRALTYGRIWVGQIHVIQGVKRL